MLIPNSCGQFRCDWRAIFKLEVSNHYTIFSGLQSLSASIAILRISLEGD